MKTEDVKPGSAKKSSAKGNKRPSLNLDPEEHLLRKRLPPSLPKTETTVYVNTKTPYKAQFVRCCKLLDDGHTCITAYGLGHAVPTAINLALHLVDDYPALMKINTTTHTVHLADDVLPLKDELDSHVNHRNNSAVKIQLIREYPIC